MKFIRIPEQCFSGVMVWGETNARVLRVAADKKPSPWQKSKLIDFF